MSPATQPKTLTEAVDSLHPTRLVVTYPQLKSIGPDFSNVQLIRLEKAGKFPRRFYLSAKKPVWYLADVEAWIAEKAAASYTPPGVQRDENKWRRSIKRRGKKAA